MENYIIHPIVMGTKVFDKGMMTYQHEYGTPYTIPIYCWYVEGGNTKILIDTGEMHPVISEDRDMVDYIIPLHEPEFVAVDAV